MILSSYLKSRGYTAAAAEPGLIITLRGSEAAIRDWLEPRDCAVCRNPGLYHIRGGLWLCDDCTPKKGRRPHW